MIDGQLNINQKEIIGFMMECQPLLKYLYYGDNSVDIIEQEDLDSSQKIELIKNKIFDYRRIPDNNSKEVSTYISMEYGAISYIVGSGYRSSSNPYYHHPTFNFYVISHNSLDRTLMNGSRINAIESHLVNLFNKRFIIPSIGLSEVVTSEPLYLPNNYVGRQIKIRFVDKSDI
ncbi:MAG: hypothetical protein RSE41_08575 [Clostridia bacterium]